MKRREFITLIGGAAAAWPLAAPAQPSVAIPLVGYLGAGTPEAQTYQVAAFRKGLSETSYIEGRNVAIEYRWEGSPFGQPARQAEMVAELVRRPVTVLVATNLNLAIAAKAVATATPIVFGATGDPVATGLVTSLNRPGGNITGITSLGGELAAKRLGLLHELVPQAARFAVLVDPITTFAKSTIEETQAAAFAIGRQVEAFTARSSPEIDAAFTAFPQKRSDALLVAPARLFDNRRVQLVTLAARDRMPVIFPEREFADAGGLMSYGANRVDHFRHVGIYVGRVLNGEKPADLPVMQPTKFELVINLQTARTLGINVPPTLLAQADEVIE